MQQESLAILNISCQLKNLCQQKVTAFLVVCNFHFLNEFLLNPDKEKGYSQSNLTIESNPRSNE